VLSIASVRQRKGPGFRLRLRRDDKKGMVRRTHSGRTLVLKSWKNAFAEMTKRTLLQIFLKSAFFFKLS
jgi:hypothetical protein